MPSRGECFPDPRSRKIQREETSDNGTLGSPDSCANGVGVLLLRSPRLALRPHATQTDGHANRRASFEAAPWTVEALVANHGAFLAFLEKRVGDRATAEDILQEAFVRGIGRADSIRDDESAVAWFYRLLRNEVVDRARRGAVRTTALEGFAAEVAGEPAPSQDSKANICACVGELAGTLKPEYAEALRRVDIDGLAVKDYAVETGISSGNAAVRIFRAREALRKQVTRSCGTCATHGCLDRTCGS